MSENYDYNLNNETFTGAENSSAPEGSVYPKFYYEYFEKNEEKGKLRKSANKTGLSLVLVVVISFLFSFPVALFSLFGKNILEDPAVTMVFQALFSITIFTLPFVICFRSSTQRISDLISFGKSKKGLALPMFFFGISFCSFANVGASSIDSIFSSFGIDYNAVDLEMPEGIFGFILSVTAIAVVPALVEEFAFRGVILGSLRKFGDTFALIVSSICFGVMHGNLEQMPFAFMVGLFLGFALLKTGSIRVSMVIHFFNNFVSVVFSYFPSGISVQIQNTIYVLFLLVTFIFGMLFLKSTKEDLFTIGNGEGVLSQGEKYKAFFTNGWVITFLAVNLLQAISYIFI